MRDAADPNGSGLPVPEPHKKPDSQPLPQQQVDTAISGCHPADAVQACVLKTDVEGLRDCWPKLYTDKWNPLTCGVSGSSLICPISLCRIVVVVAVWCLFVCLGGKGC